MSGAVDRMRERKRERLLGVAMPSLMSSADRMPGYAPSLSTSAAPGYASSLSSSDASSLQPRAPSMDFSTSSSPSLAMTMNVQQPPEQKKVSFFEKNVPGLNWKVWQVMLGGVGVLAVGFGVYKVATSSSRVVRSVR